MAKSKIIYGSTRPIHATKKDTYEELLAKHNAWIEWYDRSLQQVYEECERQITLARNETARMKAELESHDCNAKIAEARRQENIAWGKVNKIAQILDQDADDIDE